MVRIGCPAEAAFDRAHSRRDELQLPSPNCPRLTALTQRPQLLGSWRDSALKFGVGGAAAPYMAVYGCMVVWHYGDQGDLHAGRRNRRAGAEAGAAPAEAAKPDRARGDRALREP